MGRDSARFNKRASLVCSILLSICCSVCQSEPVFKVIPLGVKGGSDESNLSAYALAVNGTDAYVCLDAGTLHYGIKQAIIAKLLNGTVSEVLQNDLKGYLISHPHLDHVAGLILNSPDDSPKAIYGLHLLSGGNPGKIFQLEELGKLRQPGREAVPE